MWLSLRQSINKGVLCRGPVLAWKYNWRMGSRYIRGEKILAFFSSVNPQKNARVIYLKIKNGSLTKFDFLTNFSIYQVPPNLLRRKILFFFFEGGVHPLHGASRYIALVCSYVIFSCLLNDSPEFAFVFLIFDC